MVDIKSSSRATFIATRNVRRYSNDIFGDLGMKGILWLYLLLGEEYFMLF